MNLKVYKPFALLAILIMVVSMACSLGASPATQAPAQPTQAPQPTAASLPTQAPLPTEPAVQPTEASVQPTQAVASDAGGAVSSLQEVKKAVIQIESQGTFVDPQVGLVMNGAGRGSGFIISPDGLAVTNNHVVTGSALLKVWVGGNQDKVYNAKVLGVSECSDLAVIKIEGANFPYLAWHDGSIDVGTEMYLAGFPLGDPEYSLTKGIVSKAKADGHTSWSSVQSVIEYDATSNPGNSGGPVVDKDGKVMAIHYASYTSARQAFGISEEIAKSVIDQLRTGKNLDTIGVNGQAVQSDDGSVSGVWVSSVQSGSPADKAGVQPGDIITHMENLQLAKDGTMADYCDILRSHNAGDTLAIIVLRWANQQILEGQLNGRALAVSFQGTGDTSSGTPSSSGSAQGNPNASNSGDAFVSTEFDAPDGWYTELYDVNGKKLDSTNFTAQTDNGVLNVEVGDKNTSVYVFYDLNLVPADVRVDAAVETVAGPNRNNISVLCRATTDGWYEFSMNSGGYWYIYRYDDGDGYTTLAQGASKVINLQKAKNELTATCIGSNLTFYVNGSKLGSARDTKFKGGGQVGISVTDFDIAGAGVEFDWFTATVP